MSYKTDRYEFISKNGDKAHFELGKKSFNLLSMNDEGILEITSVFEKTDIPILIELLSKIESELT